MLFYIIEQIILKLLEDEKKSKACTFLPEFLNRGWFQNSNLKQLIYRLAGNREFFRTNCGTNGKDDIGKQVVGQYYEYKNGAYGQG